MKEIGFNLNTRVSTVNDKTTCMDLLKIGDSVLTQNTEFEYARIVQKDYVRIPKVIVIYFDDYWITCASDQKFWSVEQHDWIRAKDLCTEDTLLTTNNLLKNFDAPNLKVSKVEVLENPIKVVSLKLYKETSYFILPFSQLSQQDRIKKVLVLTRD
jgi:sulfur relay (sulfurtransferase) DsrF/TusC family protein